MEPAFPASDYYRDSAPPPGHWPIAGRPVTALAGRRVGKLRDGSHVHQQPVDGGGAQLFPCSLATSTPQAFLVASVPAPIKTGAESTAKTVVRCCPAQIHQVRAG